MTTPPQNPYPPEQPAWLQRSGYPGQPAPVAPARRRRRWPWIVGGIVVVFVIIGIAANNGGSGSSSASAAAHVAAAPKTTAAPTTTTAAKPAGPAASLSQDGTYVVGTDIKAGTWHTAGGGTLGLCYWERDKNLDGELSSIIANDGGSGPITVTVHSKDKAFKVTGGCTWQRIGG